MKVSDDLFQLIKSLTKSEKRYFKLMAQQQNAGKKYNYLKLFAAIEKQKEYDEQKIIRLFKTKTFIKHLPSEKNYLYHLILKSLSKFHAKSSHEIELDELYNAALVLYHKGLYQQCDKVAGKCIQLAQKQELFPTVLKVSELQTELNPHIADSAETLKRRFEEQYNISKQALEKLNNLVEYQHLYGLIIEQLRVRGESTRNTEEIEELQKIVKHPLLEDESCALTYKTKNIFYFLKGVYFYMIGDMEKSSGYDLKAIQLYEENPDAVNKHFNNYSAKLSNYCEVCLRTRNFRDFNFYLEKLKKLPAYFPMEKSRQFYRSVDLELRYLVNTGDFTKAIGLAGKAEEGLKEFEKKIHIARESSIIHFVAYSYFGKGDFKNALKWLNRLLNEKSDFRSDILSFSRILKCLIHLELKDYVILDSLYRSTAYFISKNEHKTRVEMCFLKHFNKICKETESGRLHQLYLVFQQELLIVVQDNYEAQRMELFDLVSWIESKIQQVTFESIVKSKHQKDSA